MRNFMKKVVAGGAIVGAVLSATVLVGAMTTPKPAAEPTPDFGPPTPDLSRDQAEAAIGGPISKAATLDDYRVAVSRSAECVKNGGAALGISLGLKATEASIVTDFTQSEDAYLLGFQTRLDVEGLMDLPQETLHAAHQRFSEVQASCFTKHVEIVQRSYQAAYRADAGRMGDSATVLASCIETVDRAGILEESSAIEDAFERLKSAARSDRDDVRPAMNSLITAAQSLEADAGRPSAAGLALLDCGMDSPALFFDSTQ